MTVDQIKIICVCGARPNFVKIASLMKAFKKNLIFEILIVHTGQHYDKNMSQLFFDELDIPQPDINLDVGSGSHAEMTAEIMRAFEPVLLDFDPDYVLVVGDVNSTIACALVASKLDTKVIHVEAGLRSFDRSMPEEINRVLTDHISDLLFVTEESGVINLMKEGISKDKVHFVGNVMTDTLLQNKDKADDSDILFELDLDGCEYGLITLHRPSNVDNEEKIHNILDAFYEIQKEIALVFPAHPRVYDIIEKWQLNYKSDDLLNFLIIPPVGYLDFLNLMNESQFVITDSGGIQEETTILGKSCLTIRDNTERPVTLTEGTNRLVPGTKKDILAAYEELRDAQSPICYRLPLLSDGKASERIVKIIEKDFS
jgi:UDP-N-acetylglucosamine 2-epimerase (non-hydrolysing)